MKLNSLVTRLRYSTTDVMQENTPVTVIYRVESRNKKQARKIRKLLEILREFRADTSSLSIINGPVHQHLSGILPQNYSFEASIEYSYYKKELPSHLQVINENDFTDSIYNLLKLLVEFESAKFENLELAVECFSIVKLNNKLLIVFCPLDEKYLSNFDLSLNYIKTIKYYKPLIQESANFDSYNPSKLLCYGLGTYILEILNRGNIPTTHNFVRICVNNIQNVNLYYLVSKMIEIDDRKKLNLKGVGELFRRVSVGRESVCSQCRIEFCAEQNFCRKNLCESCLNSKNYCQDCSHHFEVLNKSDLNSAPTKECQCGQTAIIVGLHLLCLCDTYCTVCKNPQHNGNCIDSQNSITKIKCRHKHECIRTPESLFYYCNQCEKSYCICCDKIDFNNSHIECSKQLAIDKSFFF